MKIVWIYRVLADGNTHITTWRETHRYLKATNEIHYVFPYKKEPNCFAEQATLIRRLQWPGLSFAHFVIAGFVAFLRLNRTFKPDLVVLDQFTAMYSLALLGRRRRPAIVLDLRQAKYSNDRRWFSGSVFRRYTRWILQLNRRSHDGISFISEGLRQQLTRDMRIPMHQNYLIWPSGVDTEFFSPGTDLSTDGARPFHLFFHGSVTDDRGLAECIRALAIWQRSGVPTVFTIVGGGAYLSELKRLAGDLGVADHVRFIDLVPHDQIPELIAQADVCMMAYPVTEYWEGNVPIKLLEYMAMEKVVLCSELTAFRDITRSAPCAWFIDRNSPEAIAEAIQELHSRRAQLPRMGRSGRSIVEAHYTWRAIAGDIDRFFHETVRSRKT